MIGREAVRLEVMAVFWRDWFSLIPWPEKVADAAGNGDLARLKSRLDGSPDRAVPADALFSAIFQQAPVEVLKLLLDRGANIHEPLEWGGAALHIAARYGSAAAIRFLIERGADINQDLDGTPLYWAADQGRAKTVELLLGLGADPKRVPVDAVGKSSFKPKDASKEEFERIRERLRSLAEKAES
jgi:ankyrin repeat protein